MDEEKCIENDQSTNGNDAIGNSIFSNDSNTNSSHKTLETNKDSSKNDSKSKIKPFDLDTNLVIARKLSGRYLNKKNDSSLSLKTNGSANKLSNDGSSVVNQSNKNIEKMDNKNCDDKSTDNDSNYCGICFNNFDYKTIPGVETKTETTENTNDMNNEENDDAKSESHDDFVTILCGHKFCKDCWERYLTMKIEEGSVIDIVCPQVDCFAIIPPETVESLISKETARKYFHFDIKVNNFYYYLISRIY